MLAKSTGIVHVNSRSTEGGQGAAGARVCCEASEMRRSSFSLESPPEIPGEYKTAP